MGSASMPGGGNSATVGVTDGVEVGTAAADTFPVSTAAGVLEAAGVLLVIVAEFDMFANGTVGNVLCREPPDG